MQSSGDATEISVNELIGKAVGGDATPRLSSPVGIAAAYWARAFAAAVVNPPVVADLLPAIVVRLALDGEAALVEDGSRLALASISAVKGGAAPETWTYDLTLPGPTETRSITRTRSEVAHIRLGPRDAWRGSAPWETVEYAAHTIARLETSVSIDLSPVRAQDWQVVSRAYKSFRDAGMSDADARRLLGLD